MQAGDILYSSWGGEHKSVNFYRVMSVRSGFATLIELEADRTPTSNMTGIATPSDRTKGNPFRRNIHSSKHGEYIKRESYEIMQPWDGTPQRYSTYA